MADPEHISSIVLRLYTRLAIKNIRQGGKRTTDIRKRSGPVRAVTQTGPEDKTKTIRRLYHD
jgi:uncharacterized protein with GYD domain